jgi:hypothetical protein
MAGPMTTQADGGPDPPRLVLREQDTLEQLLRLVRRLQRRNPEATSALAKALVAEGRRFASTPEGRRWQARLASSDLISRGRLLWLAAGFDRLLDGGEEPAVVPSDWLLFVADALQGTDIEALLARRLREGDTDGVVPFGPV